MENLLLNLKWSAMAAVFCAPVLSNMGCAQESTNQSVGESQKFSRAWTRDLAPATGPVPTVEIVPHVTVHDAILLSLHNKVQGYGPTNCKLVVIETTDGRTRWNASTKHSSKKAGMTKEGTLRVWSHYGQGKIPGGFVTDYDPKTGKELGKTATRFVLGPVDANFSQGLAMDHPYEGVNSAKPIVVEFKPFRIKPLTNSEMGKAPSGGQFYGFGDIPVLHLGKSGKSFTYNGRSFEQNYEHGAPTTLFSITGQKKDLPLWSMALITSRHVYVISPERNPAVSIPAIHTWEKESPPAWVEERRQIEGSSVRVTVLDAATFKTVQSFVSPAPRVKIDIMEVEEQGDQFVITYKKAASGGSNIRVICKGTFSGKDALEIKEVALPSPQRAGESDRYERLVWNLPRAASGAIKLEESVTELKGLNVPYERVNSYHQSSDGRLLYAIVSDKKKGQGPGNLSFIVQDGLHNKVVFESVLGMQGRQAPQLWMLNDGSAAVLDGTRLTLFRKGS